MTSSRSGRNTAPRLLATGRLQPTSTATRSHPVTSIAHSPSLSHLAIGFADGSVMLLRHLDQTLSSALSSTVPPLSLPKTNLLTATGKEPITGLHMLGQRLIVVSPTSILSFPANGKDTPTTLAEHGAALGCSVITPAGKLVIAKDDALFVYGPDGRESTLAYQGPKLGLWNAGHYIVVVSPPLTTPSTSAHPTVRHYAQRNRGRESAGQVARLSLFDLTHKFVGSSCLQICSHQLLLLT